MIAGGKHYILHNSRSSRFTIWCLSDLHLFNKGCELGRIKRDIQTIKDDPYSFFIGGGDYAEFVGITDKRFDPEGISEDVRIKDLGQLGRKQIQAVKELFEPIKHKCIGLLYGNHEDSYMLHQEQQDLHGWLCTELGVPNFGYCVLFDLVFVRGATFKKPKLVRQTPAVEQSQITRQSFRIFVHHGTGYAQTPGGKLNKLIQAMDYFDADIYFLNHVHDQMGKRMAELGANADCSKIRERIKLGVISGSYLKTYTQDASVYGEKKMYRPTILGAAKVYIEPDKRKYQGVI
uniref:Calcineurin-like phosphoesterase n=1 Tax=viral metagenome TaxID=1070528 RepID=A0A6M3XLI4_9ZZZZ